MVTRRHEDAGANRKSTKITESEEEHGLRILNSLQNCRESFPALMYFLFSQGYVPMFVNATAGTTVYGAFDPINEIADICEKYNLWLHVDVRVY